MNKQAQEAGARADELHETLYGTKTDGTDEVPEITLSEEAPGAVESEELEVAPVEPTETPEEEPEELKEDYETKFKVLQGKYNAEVPRLAREIRGFKKEVQTLKAQLEEKLNTAPTTTETDLKETVLDKKDFEEYDEEIQKMVDMVNNLSSTVQTLNDENILLKQSMSSVEDTTNQTLENDFLGDLDLAVPDWRTINTEPNFISWLQEMDGVSGDTRQNHLDLAADSLNATKAINIFKAFNDSRSANEVTTQVQQQQQQNIERQTQPDNVTIAAPTTEQKRSYTRADIRTFYKDVALGRYSPADKAQIEADIFAAPAEGRVIG